MQSRPHLEYIGAKPLITPNGIDFSGKEDKFNFIEPAAYLLKGLLEIDGEMYKAEISPKIVLKEGEIYDILYNAMPDFGSFIEKELLEYAEKLDQEIEKADESPFLSQYQKEVYKNNLSFMKNYRIQRATNKIVYEELINSSVSIVKNKKITAIATPFSDKFLHVCESLKSTIARERSAPKTSLDVALDREHPYAILTIGWF